MVSQLAGCAHRWDGSRGERLALPVATTEDGLLRCDYDLVRSVVRQQRVRSLLVLMISYERTIVHVTCAVQAIESSRVIQSVWSATHARTLLSILHTET